MSLLCPGFLHLGLELLAVYEIGQSLATLKTLIEHKTNKHYCAILLY